MGWDLNAEKDSVMWSFTEDECDPKEQQVPRLGSGNVSEVVVEQREGQWASERHRA